VKITVSATFLVTDQVAPALTCFACLLAAWGAGGTGIVHHIAWRTPDDASQLAARSELVSAGFNVSPVMDRNYFHSIYYREPGGVLFEIATDPPGFSVDESPEDLGSKLMLPPWLEGHRSFLEATLPLLTPSRATVRQSPDKRGSEADV
jgi:glyoxalase family protein